MNETRKLAQFITDIGYHDLSDEVISKAKGLVLEQFGCQLAFATLPWSQAVYEYIRDRKSHLPGAIWADRTPTALEGKKGFCQAFADEYSLNEIITGR